MLAKLLLWVCLLSLNQDIHWREGTALVMLAKLLLWVCLLSLNQDIHWREGTTLVMLAKLLLWVRLLSLNQDIHWREGTALVMLAKLLLWVRLLSLNQDIHWREGTALVMLAKLLLWVCLLSDNYVNQKYQQFCKFTDIHYYANNWGGVGGRPPAPSVNLCPVLIRECTTDSLSFHCRQNLLVPYRYLLHLRIRAAEEKANWGGGGGMPFCIAMHVNLP